MLKKLFIPLLCLLISNFSHSQLIVNSGFTAEQYVDVLVGDGITFYDAEFSGNVHSVGKFTTGNAQHTNLGLSEGILISTGIVDATSGASPIGSPVDNEADYGFGHTSDPQLQNLIPGYDIYDATYLTFKFIPPSDTISFQYVFASEEYPEWINANFNDVFGFFISGPNPDGGNFENKNIALIPNSSNLPVSINNINALSNFWQYYVNNLEILGQSIIFDGFTTVLSAITKVVPCEEYTIKLAIGDAGDSTIDSGVFLMANSLNSPHLSAETSFESETELNDTTIEGNCNSARLTYILNPTLSQDFVIDLEITGTAINGTDYETIPTQLTIPAGEDSVSIEIIPLSDNLVEGFETIIITTNNQLNCMTEDITTEIVIKDYIEMDLNLSPDTAICGGDATIFSNPTNGIGPYSYLWNNNIDANTQTVAPTEATTYTVTVTDFCNKTQTGEITVSIAEGYANIGADREICVGTTTTITANQATSYQWSTGETTQSISVSPTTETTYYITVTEQCVGYDTITIKPIELPTITIGGDPTEICAGENVQLSANGAENYIWTSEPLDPSIGSQSPTTNNTIQVTPKKTTIYKIVGEAESGCSNSASIKINVSQAPKASYFTQPLFATTFDPEVHFYDNSSGETAIWEWIIGTDETRYYQSDFVHSFPTDADGSYEVILIVANEKMCSDTIHGNILVKPDFTLYIPNTFSPDGDGINDKFHIHGVNLPDKKFQILIYDRSGKLIFVSSDPTFEWDGTYDGKECKQGVYVYRIYYTGTDEIEHAIHGELFILN